MSKKCLLIDSAASISAQDATKAGIYVIPLNLIDQHQKEYFDSLTIEEIGTRMMEGEFFTTSSTPTGLFIETVKNLLKKYDQVIYLAISQKLSSQFTQAELIKDEFQPNQLVVFNSKTGGYGMEALAYEIQALLDQKDFDLKQIDFLIEEYHTKLLNFFTCDELKYLARSGRGGKKVLKYVSKLFRPIIIFKDENNLETISRTLQGAITKLVKTAYKKFQELNGELEFIGLYTGMIKSNLLNLLIEQTVATFKIKKEQIIMRNEPKVVFAHTGPGTYGLFLKVK